MGSMPIFARSSSVASVPMGHDASNLSTALSSSESVVCFRAIMPSTASGGWYNNEATYSLEAFGINFARLMSTEWRIGGFLLS